MPCSVTVLQGVLKGKIAHSVAGEQFCSFKGIPYAKPPLGPLRFKPPQPADPWTGVRDATKHCPVAPQVSILTGQYVGNEDCLYLNVYTPKLPDAPGAEPRPVMVWVHGGGFIRGSGNDEVYGPDYLLQHGVVLVTFNYRIGVLGFMSTEDSVVPGNMGLKDQVMALRWVKDNISSFGGDPHNVTIFGESAGSRSCHLLMLSPMANGLFHRVVCQSAVCLSGEPTAPVRERSFRLARRLGLKEDAASSQELLQFMRTVPAETLVWRMLDSRSQRDCDLQEAFPFWPTLESADSEGGPFMTRQPAEVLASGDFPHVPIIIGVNANEGYIYVKDVLGNSAALEALESNFELLVPAELAGTPSKRSHTAERMRHFYFGGRPISEDTILQYGQMRGDSFYVHPSVRVARAHAALSPTYFYLFQVDAGLNLGKFMYRLKHLPGTSHADDVAYLFHARALGVDVQPDSVESNTIAAMSRMWTNFAKTGNPTPPSSTGATGVFWPTFKVDEESYLDITNNGLHVDRHLLKERMDFWDKLYGVKKNIN